MKKNRNKVIILFIMTFVFGATTFFSGCYRCFWAELTHIVADISESIISIIQILLLRSRLIAKSPNRVAK